MKPEEVFKRYDIRGKYPEEINGEFAERLGRAVGTFIRRKYNGRAVVCRDNKDSSKNLKEYLTAGIQSVGVDVVDVGKGPTDYAAYAGNKKNSVSVQVTSSHMPRDFNGFKFMYPEGNGFKNPDLDELKQLFRESDFERGDGLFEQENLQQEYLEDVEKFISEFDLNFDQEIVVDALKGSSMLEELLNYLDIDFKSVGRSEMPDPPNPKPENLEKLEEETNGIGFANDLDADRVTVYHKDRFLSGNEVTGVLAQAVGGDVVASVDTSESLKQVIDGDLMFTRVGDPFVMDRAIEEEVEFAAEPNGHYAFPEFVAYNSGTVAAVLLAGLDLNSLLENLPDIEFRRESFSVEDKEAAMQEIEEAITGYELISDIDGFKVKKGDEVVLARPSGSSEKVRLIGESGSGSFDLLEELGSVLEKC